MLWDGYLVVAHWCEMRKRGDVFPFVVVVVEASCLRVNDWFFFFLATSVCLSSVFPLLKVIHTQSREVGRYENMRGGSSSNVVEISLSAPLVGIGLTDLPKSGWVGRSLLLPALWFLRSYSHTSEHYTFSMHWTVSYQCQFGPLSTKKHVNSKLKLLENKWNYSFL